MLSFWVIRIHWMGKASCFLGHRSGVMILTMDAGKSLFIKLVHLFCLGSLLSCPSPPPAQRKISVNYETELLNKYMLTPDFPSCVHFTVCYTAVISCYSLTHIPSLAMQDLDIKSVSVNLYFCLNWDRTCGLRGAWCLTLFDNRGDSLRKTHARSYACCKELVVN